MKIKTMKILKTAKNALKERIRVIDENHENYINKS